MKGLATQTRLLMRVGPRVCPHPAVMGWWIVVSYVMTGTPWRAIIVRRIAGRAWLSAVGEKPARQLSLVPVAMVY